MKRHLLNVLTALSLLLCVAVVLAWIGSYVYRRPIEWGDGRQSVGYVLWFNRGTVSFQMATGLRPIRLREVGGFMETAGSRDRYYEECLGVHVIRWDDERSTEPGVSYGEHLEVWSNFWLPFFICALLPAWRLVRDGAQLVGHFRRWMHRKDGSCPHCGYDLRATPGRCPECGRTAKATA